MRHVNVLVVLVAALAALSLGPSSSHAATNFVATIDGQQAGTPSNAEGTGSFVLRDDGMLEFEISYSGLGSAEIAAHFHGPAQPGVNAGVTFPLPPGNPKVGEVGPLNQQQQADLLANLWYVNIHTNGFPGGEIRGQVVQSAVAVEGSSWSAVKALYED